MSLAISGRVVEALRRSTVVVRCGAPGDGMEDCGSGVLITGGRVITNAHVLRRPRVSVERWDGGAMTATITRVDRRRDLALLTVEGRDDSPAILGDSDRLRPGMPVMAVGNPLGFIGAASSGTIHAVNGRWVQADVRLAPGNSGGPLATASGEVVGINTMVMQGGLALAIPSRAVQAFLRRGESGRKLGAVLRPVGRYGQREGWLLLELTSGGAAERASLLPGDVLVNANGTVIVSADQLQDLLDTTPGGVLHVQFRRGGQAQLRQVAVRLQERAVGNAA